MLTAHGDKTGDGLVRVLAHNAGYNVADECWMIDRVQENGETGYTIRKSQVYKDTLIVGILFVNFQSHIHFQHSFE